jgi:hypothetical protein
MGYVNNRHDEIRVQRFNTKKVLKTYIIRGNRVSVVSHRNGTTHEKDLPSNSEQKREILASL